MTDSDQELLRVVYFSRFDGDHSDAEMAWEIDAILEASQRNNAKVGVTGALIFNAGVFGQVLEGPIDAVEETFDRIQMDDRHDDVTILELGRVQERAFTNWSMGFVGADQMHAQLFDRIGSATHFDISNLTGVEIFEALYALTLKNEIAMRAA
ncbi:BLUF domain-containing protein [uncultured Roseobacter sp.]|uniref:BLUF domain-containing protein n=1 Tax=uncultured Roseobacter sp. TaxID=114847 RepID=UPI0026347C7D|nr:BLUF domain-containing protein [uncultured Roseobacter sp.]